MYNSSTSSPCSKGNGQIKFIRANNENLIKPRSTGVNWKYMRRIWFLEMAILYSSSVDLGNQGKCDQLKLQSESCCAYEYALSICHTRGWPKRRGRVHLTEHPNETNGVPLYNIWIALNCQSNHSFKQHGTMFEGGHCHPDSTLVIAVENGFFQKLCIS